MGKGKTMVQDDPITQIDSVNGNGLTEKIRSVLDLAADQPFEGYTAFEQEDEDGEAAWLKQYVIPTQDWEDMGSPEMVTVTIVPGDTLTEKARKG
jgi:hypothetical protein